MLFRSKEETEKVGLKLNVQKTKIMASSPITSWQIHKHSFSLDAKYWVAPNEPNGLTEEIYGPSSLQVG